VCFRCNECRVRNGGGAWRRRRRRRVGRRNAVPLSERHACCADHDEQRGQLEWLVICLINFRSISLFICARELSQITVLPHGGITAIYHRPLGVRHLPKVAKPDYLEWSLTQNSTGRSVWIPPGQWPVQNIAPLLLNSDSPLPGGGAQETMCAQWKGFWHCTDKRRVV
jgi:hypothetical protein